MDGTLCCNPIHVDDELIDMELEEVWEIQRNRSKGGRGTSSKRKGRLNILRGGARRGFSLSRNNANKSAPMKTTQHRSMSTGRNILGNQDRGRSRSPWRRKRDSKKVSISKYVEKIELNPKQRQNGQRPRSRGRDSIAGPVERIRDRSRSWSIGRKNRMGRGRQVKMEKNIVRVRSRSTERKSNFFGMGRRRESRHDDSYDSSSDDSSFDEYSTRQGFFSAFR